MSDRRKSKKKKKYVDKDSPPGSRESILKRNISGHIERPSVSKWDTQTDSFDITQPIHIWVRKDDDDPLPFEINNLHMTIHDLKIQLFKVFGDDLELTKPNKLKLRVNGNILLPQNKVYQVLFDGATLDIFVNSAVDFDEIDTQGNGMYSKLLQSNHVTIYSRDSVCYGQSDEADAKGDHRFKKAFAFRTISR